jgi:CubicO group peptidase (beta-lactamase class C family)
MGKGSTMMTFGHFGLASCMAWADPDRELVVAFTCEGILSLHLGRVRWVELSDAVWDAIED